MVNAAQQRASRSWIRGLRARVVLLLTFLVATLSPLRTEAREGEVELCEECDEEVGAEALARPAARTQRRAAAGGDAAQVSVAPPVSPRVIDDGRAPPATPRWLRPRRVHVPDEPPIARALA